MPSLKPFLALALLCGLIVRIAPAAPDTAPRPRAAADRAETASAAVELDRAALGQVKAGSEIMANLQYLSDIIGHRVTGSKSLQKANEWAAERMKSYGLENVRLEPWEVPVGWERGTARLKVVEPDNGRELLVAARGWTPGTEGKVTGDVVLLSVRTKDDLKAYKGKLKDAIVLLGPPATVAPITDARYGPPPVKADGKPDPAKEAKSPTGRPPLPSWYPFRAEVYSFLKAEGVACVVTDSAKPHGLLVTTGSWPTGDRGTPQEVPPGVFMAHEHYALLHRLASRPAPARTARGSRDPQQVRPRPDHRVQHRRRGPRHREARRVRGRRRTPGLVGPGQRHHRQRHRQLRRAGGRPRRGRAGGQGATAASAPSASCCSPARSRGCSAPSSTRTATRTRCRRRPRRWSTTPAPGKVLGLGLQGREAVRKVLEPELASLKDLGGSRA